ncbi:MAG: hypothetical protein A2234_10805 [Elusimicrobia bacterium RIFOXYA2_FULL_58_8]|nr:MAG: hypothetical protein A2234_10805 [Elusimicrobia bacterium RIFOXYA2_FULL_58_8]
MTAGLLTMLSSPSDLPRTAVLWGFAVASFGWIYTVTIRREEEFLSKTYGEEFRNYITAVPCICPCAGLTGFFDTTAYSREVFLKNKEWRGISAALALVVFAGLRIKFKYGF